jgi:DNA-binding XRE family transcriptional regulator
MLKEMAVLLDSVKVPAKKSMNQEPTVAFFDIVEQLNTLIEFIEKNHKTKLIKFLNRYKDLSKKLTILEKQGRQLRVKLQAITEEVGSDIATYFKILATKNLDNQKVTSQTAQTLLQEHQNWTQASQEIYKELNLLYEDIMHKLASWRISIPNQNTNPQTFVGDIVPTDDYLVVMSSQPYQAIREAIYKNKFNKEEGSPWPTANLTKQSIRGYAQLLPIRKDYVTVIPPNELEALSKRMWEQREELSDLDADAMDALTSIWLSQARSPQDDARADVDVILRMRNIKPKVNSDGYEGGYRDNQKLEILNSISRIQNLWLDVAEMEVYEEYGKNRRKLVKKAFQSRAFLITDRMGQRRPDGYDIDVEHFIFKPGKIFAHFLFGPGRQTALLSAKAIEYDPYRQKWEKRLTRYLSWQWRCDAKNIEQPRRFRVSTLLEAVGENINERYPNRTKDRLEKALNVLLEDNVIADWEYQGWDENIIRNQRNWSTVYWQNAQMVITPPESVREQYKQFEVVESKVISSNSSILLIENLGRKIKQRRKEMELSQKQAAQQLGISQPYLSLLEGDKFPVENLSPETRNRLQQWLGLNTQNEL